MKRSTNGSRSPTGPNASRDELFAQQALQQAEVGRVSETQPSELPEAEPLDGVVLLWLHVHDFSAPAARHPDSEVQASIGNDTVQYRRAVNALQLDPQFLGYLPPERILRPFLPFDMPASEVPHVWIPPPRRRPVTQQQPICLLQDHGHDAMAGHAASVTVSPDGCQARQTGLNGTLMARSHQEAAARVVKGLVELRVSGFTT